MAAARQPAHDKPRLARWSQKLAGFSVRRSLPRWRTDCFRETAHFVGAPDAPQVVLFADTFNRYFEPENIDAALAVLAAAGRGIHLPHTADRPLCCGRTFLAVGLVDEARREAERCVAGARPARRAGIPVVGLSRAACSASATRSRRWSRPRRRAGWRSTCCCSRNISPARRRRAGSLLAGGEARLLLHGHCHQKAFGAMGAVEAALACWTWPSRPSTSSCCGMAGAFGYHADTIDVSLKMAELSPLPAVRKAEPDTLVRRRRHLLPAPDQGRRRPRGAACGARVAMPFPRELDESGGPEPEGHAAAAAAYRPPGRLLRPARMADRPQEARRPVSAVVRARELWRVAPEWLDEAQDATRIAIRDQERAGLDIITDGEMRRESYSNRFATALEGVDVDNPGTALDRSGHPNPVRASPARCGVGIRSRSPT